MREDLQQGPTFQELLDFGTFLMERQDHFISYVDTRASILLGANIAHIGVLVSLVDPTKWWNWSIALLSLVFILASIVCTYLAVRPTHIDLDEPENLIYWGHISREKRRDYVDNLMQASAEKVLGDVSSEIYTISLIVKYKYLRIRSAIDLFIGSAAMTVLLLIVRIFCT